MDGVSQICDGPTSRPAISVFQNLAPAAAQTRPKPNFEKQKWLAGWLAHHISGFPHPFWGYIMYFVYNRMYVVYDPTICKLFAYLFVHLGKVKMMFNVI